MGCESATAGERRSPFQITQRADFFEEEVGLETTLKRPIVNARDEPHCDSQKYRRLHVIVGDANLSEVSTFLKVGTTTIVLAMIEDDWFAHTNRDFSMHTPVASMRAVSYDLSLGRPIELSDGRSMTALEMQWEHLDLARKYAEDHGLEAVGGEEIGRSILRRWEETLSGLESDPMSLAGQLDWVAKYRLFSAYRERHDLTWDDPRLAAMDLQYHDVNPQRSLYARLGMERVIDPVALEAAVTEPPETTRAYFRGKCLQRWASSVAAANWDSVVFDLGSDPLRRVPMMEPLAGPGHLLRICSIVCRARRSCSNAWVLRRDGERYGRTRTDQETGSRTRRLRRRCRRSRLLPRRARSSRRSSTTCSTRSTRCSRRTPRSSSAVMCRRAASRR